MTAASGAVTGRIQAQKNRHGCTFMLYEDTFDQPVTCYLGDEQVDMIQDKWGHRAIVEGIVSRDPATGRPMNIRRVSNVSVLPDVEAGSYRLARGAAPIGPDALLPEEAIRRVRDAG